MEKWQWAMVGLGLLVVGLLVVAILGWTQHMGSNDIAPITEPGWVSERWLSVVTTDESGKALGAWPNSMQIYPVHSLPVNASLPQTFIYSPCQLVPVQNQGACQTCTAFSAYAMLANRWGLLSGKPPEMLSVQQFMDDTRTACSTTLELGVALKYAERVGLMTARVYPYTEKSGAGLTDQGVHPRVFATNISRFYPASGWQVGDGAHQEHIRRAKSEIYAYGPICTTMAWYRSLDANYRVTVNGKVQVYGGPAASDVLLGYHAVQIIGWGEGYWVCTSSWGTSWPPGELTTMPGAFFVAMGKNVCGIERDMMVAYAYELTV